MLERRIEIRWRDMDAYGHVNNAVYLNFLEEVLWGADTAIEWTAGGEQWAAADALKVGAVDAVVARPTCATQRSGC